MSVFNPNSPATIHPFGANEGFPSASSLPDEPPTEITVIDGVRYLAHQGEPRLIMWPCPKALLYTDTRRGRGMSLDYADGSLRVGPLRSIDPDLLQKVRGIAADNRRLLARYVLGFCTKVWDLVETQPSYNSRIYFSSRSPFRASWETLSAFLCSDEPPGDDRVAALQARIRLGQLEPQAAADRIVDYMLSRSWGATHHSVDFEGETFMFAPAVLCASRIRWAAYDHFLSLGGQGPSEEPDDLIYGSPCDVLFRSNNSNQPLTLRSPPPADSPNYEPWWRALYGVTP